MDAVAVLYLSCGPWFIYGNSENHYPPTPVRVYRVMQDGSTVYHATGTFESQQGVLNPYGYEGVSDITPAGADIPSGTGALLSWIGYSPSLMVDLALYGSEDDLLADIAPTAISVPSGDVSCMTFWGGSTQPHSCVVPLFGTATLPAFWTSLTGTKETL